MSMTLTIFVFVVLVMSEDNMSSLYYEWFGKRKKMCICLFYIEIVCMSLYTMSGSSRRLSLVL